MSRLDQYAKAWNYILGLSPRALEEHFLRHRGIPVRNRDLDRQNFRPWSESALGMPERQEVVHLDIREVVDFARRIGEPIPQNIIRFIGTDVVAPPNPDGERPRQTSYSVGQGIRSPIMYTEAAPWNPNYYAQIQQAQRNIDEANALMFQMPALGAVTQTSAELLEKAKQDKAEAEKKAAALLASVLPTESARQYADHGCVDFTGAHFKYVIWRKGQTDMRSLECGCKKATACIQLDLNGDHPAEDRVVAEYLLLRNDEKKYLTTANLSWFDTADRKAFEKQFKPSSRHGFGWLDAIARDRFQGLITDTMNRMNQMLWR